MGARCHKILEFVSSCPIYWSRSMWRPNEKLRIGLVMRLFSCGANLWRSSANIPPKKVQPLGFYFWHLRLDLLKVTFVVGEAEHMCLHPFARANVSSALQAFHGGIFLLVRTFAISELERKEKMSSAAGDIAVQNRLGWGYLITDKPKSSDLCPKVLEKIPSLMSDLCKSSIVTVQNNPCSQPCEFMWKTLKKHTPSNNHGSFFSGVWHTYISSSELTPHEQRDKAIFLLPNICTPKENNVEPKFLSWVRRDAWM